MAVDWHMSTLISPGIVKVVGASPPFVLMPEMGSVQSLQIRTPPRSKMQVCGTYKSDTHYEGKNRAPILGRGGAQAVSAVVHQIELEKSNMVFMFITGKVVVTIQTYVHIHVQVGAPKVDGKQCVDCGDKTHAKEIKTR